MLSPKHSDEKYGSEQGDRVAEEDISEQEESSECIGCLEQIRDYDATTNDNFSSSILSQTPDATHSFSTVRETRDMQKTIVELREENALLHQMSREDEISLKNMRSSLDKETEAKERAQRQLAQCQVELDIVRSQLMAATAECGDVRTMRERMQALAEENAELVEEAQMLRNQGNGDTEAIRRLRTELEERRLQVHQYTAQIVELTSLKREQAASIATSEEHAKQLRESNAALTAEVEVLESKVYQYENEDYVQWFMRKGMRDASSTASEGRQLSGSPADMLKHDRKNSNTSLPLPNLMMTKGEFHTMNTSRKKGNSRNLSTHYQQHQQLLRHASSTPDPTLAPSQQLAEVFGARAAVPLMMEMMKPVPQLERRRTDNAKKTDGTRKFMERLEDNGCYASTTNTQDVLETHLGSMGDTGPQHMRVTSWAQSEIPSLDCIDSEASSFPPKGSARRFSTVRALRKFRHSHSKASSDVDVSDNAFGEIGQGRAGRRKRGEKEAGRATGGEDRPPHDVEHRNECHNQPTEKESNVPETVAVIEFCDKKMQIKNKVDNASDSSARSKASADNDDMHQTRNDDNQGVDDGEDAHHDAHHNRDGTPPIPPPTLQQFLKWKQQQKEQHDRSQLSSGDEQDDYHSQEEPCSSYKASEFKVRGAGGDQQGIILAIYGEKEADEVTMKDDALLRENEAAAPALHHNAQDTKSSVSAAADCATYVDEAASTGAHTGKRKMYYVQFKGEESARWLTASVVEELSQGKLTQSPTSTEATAAATALQAWASKKRACRAGLF